MHIYYVIINLKHSMHDPVWFWIELFTGGQYSVPHTVSVESWFQFGLL